MLRGSFRIWLPAMFLVAVTACDTPTDPAAGALDSTGFDSPGLPAPSVTLTELAAEASESETPEFTVLVDALEAADLLDLLSGPRAFTVFAPSHEAFGRLLDALEVTAEELFADTDLLRDILLYHLANGDRSAEDIVESEQIRTLQGGSIPLRFDPGTTRVDDPSDR